jgi:hypothetical protein
MLDGLFVYIDDGKDLSNLPIDRILFGTDSATTLDSDDIIVACVHEPMLSQHKKALFFPHIDGRPSEVGDLVLCVGYPTAQQQVLPTDDGLRLRIDCLSGRVVECGDCDSGITAKVRYENPVSVIDGMSGGGVFSVRLRDSFEVSFTGLIQRGGLGSLRFLHARRILEVINTRK